MPLIEKPLTEGYIPYYPSKKYIRKNWAPEKFPSEALRAIAKAEVAAGKSGLLSSGLASSLLPIALVEGRPDLGLNWLGYPKSSGLESNIRAMGLSVGQFTNPPGSENWGDFEWEKWEQANPAEKDFDVVYTQNNPQETGYWVPAEEGTEEFINNQAKLAAVMLAQKAKLYGEDKAIERWNGIGPMAENHARKVEEMRRMLNDPKNAKLRKAYGKFLLEARK